MKKSFCTCSIIIGLTFFRQAGIYAQNGTMDNVHLFQSFFRDAPITVTPYGEGFANYSNFDFADFITGGIQGGAAVTPEIEVGTGIYFLKINPDEVDSESGITDIPVFGRYNFLNEETKLSGGAYVTLPVGSEVIGEENFDFGVFGAVRHPASETIALTGTLGIDFLETGIDREASLYLGAGMIYAASNELSVVGELSVQSDIDYSALSGGVDYKVADNAHLRGNLLLGLDEGAPDFGLRGGFLFTL